MFIFFPFLKDGLVSLVSSSSSSTAAPFFLPVKGGDVLTTLYGKNKRNKANRVRRRRSKAEDKRVFERYEFQWRIYVWELDAEGRRKKTLESPMTRPVDQAPSELVWMLISSNHVYFPLQIPKLDEAEARGKRARKRRELKRELLRKDPSICTALIYL